MYKRQVLRVAHRGQCYVEEDEDMVDCGLQFLQVRSHSGVYIIPYWR